MEHNQDKALKQAADKLRSSHVDEVCLRCGVGKTNKGLKIEYFNKKYEISLPSVTFTPSSLSVVSRLLILHYLTSNGKKEMSEEFVGFRDLPGGMFYYSAYRKQGPERIVKAFRDEPKKIYSAAKLFGGEKARFGDASVKFKVLPHIDVMIVLYHADEEFPEEAYVLFKNNIINFLSLKDISMLTGEIAGRLTK